MTSSDRPSTLSAEELAARAGIDVGHLAELTAAGVLRPGPDGRHRIGDVHRIRIADAFLDAGIGLESLRRANEAGAISFRYYDLLHPEPGEPSTRTYGDLKAELGAADPGLGQLFAALGLAEPDGGSFLAADDEAFLVELRGLVEGTGSVDLGLRAIRLLADAARRATDAVMTVYDEAVGRIVDPAGGLPSQETFDTYLVPWSRVAQITPRLGSWLTERHLSNAIDAYSVASTERFLGAGGFVAPRAQDAPAIAFVDLSGFTRLGEERGDERAARVALEFGRLAEAHAERDGGRLVKLLGDGALLRFPSARPAVDAVLRLLAALPAADLPAGHAGIDAGAIVVRDGDVFGRTVNVASRVSDVAEPGQLLVTAAAASALEAGAYGVAAAGEALLPGIAEPVELFAVARRIDSGDGA
jgi:adenylate cyclase